MSVLYDFNLILLGGKNKKRPGLIITKETTNFGGREKIWKRITTKYFIILIMICSNSDREIS